MLPWSYSSPSPCCSPSIYLGQSCTSVFDNLMVPNDSAPLDHSGVDYPLGSECPRLTSTPSFLPAHPPCTPTIFGSLETNCSAFADQPDANSQSPQHLHYGCGVWTALPSCTHRATANGSAASHGHPCKPSHKSGNLCIGDWLYLSFGIEIDFDNNNWQDETKSGSFCHISCSISTQFASGQFVSLNDTLIESEKYFDRCNNHQMVLYYCNTFNRPSTHKSLWYQLTVDN